MRELFLVTEESTVTSLVLRAEDGEQFFVALDQLSDTARSALDVPKSPPAPEVTPKPAPEPTPPPVRAQQSDRHLPTPDPLLTAPLTMRPRDIQGRIRGGATVTELAEEMGVAESRVEPFAHPVILERERIADLAKQSHPVREDGPAKLTLWEVLAAAFAARGNSVADSSWDAYREPGGSWVIRVQWSAGRSENEAEWTLINHASSSATTEPRNAIAADLTDPDFIQPVRTLTSVGRGNRYEEDYDGDESDDQPHEGDGETTGEDAQSISEQQNQPTPTKRRRKAVTPHWEDVLLGVRTNTKRPRS
ncbi:septation protein SepH [Corynebacterium alimapuense]|uniref:DUF3071 domain-containing protein n=1 Tax=Corynebacterium alimapuense TaxID=1576874 RepID=A0A3M8K606_9CORY|nr:septation protein SepH [Corynebacterium alimapuense]RNE48641.1 DUF3071 domain-containing protein [Corynebacterium alimapuense]